MAPPPRCGAKGADSNCELSLGDLVLAKVKGFPAWPAKISRPEDWDRAPDPKKCFVQFFGTSETAFVAAADIQAFTIESKNKLSARCQGKTVRYFSQAVKEICEEFETLQCKDVSSIRDDNKIQNLASETLTVNPVVNEALDVDGNDETDREELNCKLETKEPIDIGPVWKCCSQKQGEMKCEKMGKRLLKETTHCDAVGRVDEVIFEESNEVISRKKTKFQHFKEKGTSCTNEAPFPAKISKYAGTVDDPTKLRTQTSRSDGCRSPVHLDYKLDSVESKRSIPGGNAENHLRFRAQRITKDSNHFTYEDDLPPTKRHCRALEVMSCAALISEDRPGNFESRKNGFVHSNKVQSPIMQWTEKRRAVCLCDDDDVESPKTPIHGGFTHKVSNSCVPVSKKKDGMRGNRYPNDQLVFKNPGIVDDSLREQIKSFRVFNKPSSSTAQQSTDKRTRESSDGHVFPGPYRLDSAKSPFMEAKQDIFSTKRSPRLVNWKSSAEPQKKHFNKAPILEAKPGVVSPKRSPRSVTAPKSSTEPQKKHFSNAPIMEDKPAVVCPRMSPRSITSPGPSAKSEKKHFSNTPTSIAQKNTPSGVNRGLLISSDRSASSLDQSVDEKGKPAPSRVKMKTTLNSGSQMNNSVSLGNPDESIASLGVRLNVGKDTKTSFSVDLKTSDSSMSMKNLIAAAQARKKQAHLQNSSPTPATLAVESSNTTQLDIQALQSTSLSLHIHQYSSISLDNENEGLEEQKLSSGHQTTSSSLSEGSEAAVARDAFEGMIETLSRTKESIGRATRLAIDCAKYGIANEVVELLIQKLESEPSFHRKVDLFFLVDSITQCSYSQKGVAGASYIPMVQAALPRLVGAAAPPGAGAQENRRQCHKVLRLWLERKILPESILRRYMDDIGTINDDTSVGVSRRLPSRSERSVDDPIREMEGIFLDEYGSNATFQLPGLVTSHLFEEEEEDIDNFPTKLCEEVSDTSQSEHPSASKDPEKVSVTPSDRRHWILEDVDGELEMEDVSGDQKDEKPSIANDTSEVSSLDPKSVVIFESASNMSELLLSPEGTPPLPPGSPPVTPPLPNSPPPSPPPPPPPPPSSSPSAPPPPPSSQQQLFPPPPVGPPPFLSQQTLPPQAILISRPLAYHPPLLPHEIGGKPTVIQHVHMISSTLGSHIDAAVSSEVFSRKSPLFAPAAVSSSQEQSGCNSSSLVEYWQDDAYVNPKASQQRQPLLSGAAFVQGALLPEPLSKSAHSLFSHQNAGQQHRFPPYSLPKFSSSLRRYATDEQRHMQGYFGPPPEKPLANALNFQPSAANSPANALSVHGVLMIPSRPDISEKNWRPA